MLWNYVQLCTDVILLLFMYVSSFCFVMKCGPNLVLKFGLLIYVNRKLHDVE